jgi:hypothetical protein
MNQLIGTKSDDIFDRQLSLALDLDLRESAFSRITGKVATAAREFKNDMIELGQKIASATAKIQALLFMTDLEEAENSTNDPYAHSLDFAPILIAPQTNFAPPSVPVAMGNEEEVTAKQSEMKAATLKIELAKELKWFKQYGKEGILTSSTSLYKPSAEKAAKRHLSIVKERDVHAA